MPGIRKIALVPIVFLFFFAGSCGGGIDEYPSFYGAFANYSFYSFDLSTTEFSPLPELPDYSGKYALVVNNEIILTSGQKFDLGSGQWKSMPKLPGNVLVNAGNSVYCVFPYSQFDHLENDLALRGAYDGTKHLFLNEIHRFNASDETLAGLGGTPLDEEAIFYFVKNNGFSCYNPFDNSVCLFVSSSVTGNGALSYDIAGNSWNFSECPYGAAKFYPADDIAVLNGKVYCPADVGLVRYDLSSGTWDIISSVPVSLINSPRVILKEKDGNLWVFAHGAGNCEVFRCVESGIDLTFESRGSFCSVEPYYISVLSDMAFLFGTWGEKEVHLCNDEYRRFDVYYRYHTLSGNLIFNMLFPSPHAGFRRALHFTTDEKSMTFNDAIVLQYNGKTYFIGGYIEVLSLD